MASEEIMYVTPFPIHCKICGFHGGDYEECRLLGIKPQFVPHRNTHYVFVTELGRLMLRCKIVVSLR
jgi:hypothetical protein